MATNNAKYLNGIHQVGLATTTELLEFKFNIIH